MFKKVQEVPVVVKLMIEKNKAVYLEEDFLDFLLQEENVEKYEEILEKEAFSYVRGKKEQQTGYGKKQTNQEVSLWLAKNIADYLKQQTLITKKQAVATLCVLANSIASNYQTFDKNLFKYHKMSPLLNTEPFKRTLKENNIKTETVQDQETPEKEYLKKAEHKKTDEVYKRN